MTQTIGIAGTGRMGTAFARRLIETGHAVKVWNRRPERTSDAVAAGAFAVDLPGLAACDILILSLTDGAASQTVLRDLADAGLSGRLVIEMSTLLPDDAEALVAAATAAGADFVHCPVGGTVAPALKGQLLGLAGGTGAAFDRAKPLLDALCRRVEHLGTVSAAARMKLAVNLPLAIYWQTLGESLALLRGSGVSDDLAISLMADSSAGPTVLKNRAQVVVDTLAGTDQKGTFDVAGLAKDLSLALALAKAEGAELPLSHATAQRYATAISDGLGSFDGASLTRQAAGK
jgi:3-hydroxyisobutyrate dehydrogenase